MGQQIFDVSGSFTVPTGVSTVTICMVGGGASGASSEGFFQSAGGGLAGQVVSQAFAVTAGAVLSVVVGVGGTPASDVAGTPGTQSSFDSLIASGGAGGERGSDYTKNFAGNGEVVTTCGGTGTNGLFETNSPPTTAAWGGQSSGFGSGGNGSLAGTATAGGIGAGGGANIISPSGSGGVGRVVVNWDDPLPPAPTPEFRINGTVIPRDTAGDVRFYCKDQTGADFDGLVNSVILDGNGVWIG